MENADKEIDPKMVAIYDTGYVTTYLKASGFSDLESKTNLSILNRVIASPKTSSNKSQNRSFSSTPSMTMCVKQVRKLSLEIKVRSRISLEQNVKTLMGATWDSNLSWKPTVLVTWTEGRIEWILKAEVDNNVTKVPLWKIPWT